MEDSVMVEESAGLSEEMTAEQEVDFEANLDGDAQTADVDKTEEAQDEDVDINEEDIEDAAESNVDDEQGTQPGVTVALDGQTYTFSQEELESYMPAPSYERQVLGKIAEQSGIEYDQLLGQLENSLDEVKSDMRAKQLAAQGYDPGMAQHIARIELENAKYKNSYGTGDRESAKIAEGIVEFETMYPDVHEFPPSVIREVRAGITPVAAYQKYLLYEREQELKALEQEKRNRERAFGSIRGVGVGAEDPFLSELMK